MEYRLGRLNSVADALSRRDEDAVAALALSGPSFALYDDIRATTWEDPVACGLLQQQAAGMLEGPWTIADGLLHGKRVYVPDLQDLRHQVVTLAHTTGHEGVQKTLVRLRSDFHIPGDRKLVQDYVRTCGVCQRNKTPTTQLAGLLQHLDVPSQVWADISMDFNDALPKVHGKSVILTVVDRFSQYKHFIALSHPYTAASVAHAFFEGIVRLHGFPTSIVSDRDPIFTSHLWRDLFRLAGVKQRLSMAFHSQTDGQSEVVNKVIAMYLRYATGDRPRSWVDWLPWAEYCYNTSYRTVLRATPFEIVYGRPPPPLLPHQEGAAETEDVDVMLWDRDPFLVEVLERLLQAQQHTKERYDEHHRVVDFAVGDWVRSDFFTAPHTRSRRRPRASFILTMLVRSVCWNALGRWPIVYSCPRLHTSMMFSTSGCSSSGMVILL